MSSCNGNFGFCYKNMRFWKSVFNVPGGPHSAPWTLPTSYAPGDLDAWSCMSRLRDLTSDLSYLGPMYMHGVQYNFICIVFLKQQLEWIRVMSTLTSRGINNILKHSTDPILSAERYSWLTDITGWEWSSGDGHSFLVLLLSFGCLFPHQIITTV